MPHEPHELEENCSHNWEDFLYHLAISLDNPDAYIGQCANIFNEEKNKIENYEFTQEGVWVEI